MTIVNERRKDEKGRRKCEEIEDDTKKGEKEELDYKVQNRKGEAFKSKLSANETLI